MKKQLSQKNKRILLCIMIAVLAVIAICAVFTIKRFLRYSADGKLLRESEYNSVFLSMFPIDTFDEADFLHFRGDQVLKITTTLRSWRTLRSYLSEVSLSENDLRVLYLGVDPKKINAAMILQVREMFPGVQLEVIPAYRPLQEWQKDSKSSETLDAYYELTDHLVGQENIRVFSYFAQEWLIADNSNYLSGLLLEKETARLLYIYTDELHHCDFTRDDILPIFNEMKELLQAADSGENQYPDLSGWNLVFFGDSIFGNYTGHHSIPGVTAYLSGSTCYNCGWGGATASGSKASGGIQVIGSYLDGVMPDIPEGIAARDGLSQFMADEKNMDPQKEVFLLHYGINDYLQGVPLETEDPYDPGSYCGAMRLLIEKLQSKRPDAKILLVAPNTITCYQAGEALMAEDGAPLSAYREALKTLAGEYSLPFQDDSIGIVPIEKADRLLDGELHPNEYGRYRIAKALVKTLGAFLP